MPSFTPATATATRQPRHKQPFSTNCQAPTWQGRYGGLQALLAGALAPLGFAPFELWPLTILSCLGLLIAIQSACSAKQAALRGWLYGIGLFGAGVSWVFVSIHRFGNAPIPLALLMTALFVVAIALLFSLHSYLYKRWLADRPLAIILGFPALWVLAEWFRSWFLTGFPWLLSGYAPLDSWLAGWGPITGVYGLSGFSVFLASCLYLMLRASWRLRIGLGLLAGLPFISGALLQAVSWTAPAAQPAIRVALIQGNIPQQLKWSTRYRDTIIEQYLSLSEALLNKDNTESNSDTDHSSELIIWPETAVPLLYDIALPRLAPFVKTLADNQVGLISGVPYRTRPAADTPTRYHNSIMGLGAAEGLYHKQRLVPFGEYVPLEAWLRGLIDFFNLPMSSFSLGPSGQAPLELHRGELTTRLSAYICYEIVYPDLVATNARHSELLLTISNDSWFGDSLAPHQHLQMARMRALETGRYLIRGTNNGISALINDKGEVLQQGPQFVTDVLQGDVQPMTGTTPFVRYGSMPLLLLCGVLLGGMLVSGRQQTDASQARR